MRNNGGVDSTLVSAAPQKNLEIHRRSKMSEAELEELERKETEVWTLVASQQLQRQLIGHWFNGVIVLPFCLLIR